MNPMCQAPKFYWLAERLFCVSPAERSIPVPNGANCLASCDCLIPFACFNRTPITGLFRAQSSEASTGESLFLSCLPLQIEEWAKALAAARQYYSHLLDYISQDPRSNSSSFHSDHPLSLEEDSCWKQHFMDQELKSRIRQDVNRTFPGIEYFGSAAVRETMCRLLFIYAKENPHISYKQGMHEIVGPIMFVFYSDQQAFKHIDEQLELRSLDPFERDCLANVFDEAYFEHDVYNVFLSIMKILQPFYFQGEVRKQSFDSTDGTATCPLLAKLEWIMGTLKVVNEDLYEHLKALQVPPEAYGIRWMRLLFGREFPLQDLLLIWDTIFAKSPPYQLIECIFVQMLCWIAPVLLQSDYTGCLQRLMKFPTVMDVLELLRRARCLESDIEKGCLNRVINLPVSERNSSKTKGDSIFGSVFPRRSIDSDRHALPAARQFAPPAIINAKLPNVYAAKREAVVRTSRELAKQSEPPEKTRHRPSDTYEQIVCLQRRCNYAADQIDRCVESMESTARNVDENNGIYLKKMAAELASVSLILKENKCLEKSSNNQNRLPPKRVDGAVEIARESLPSDSIIEEMPTSARLMLKKENMLQVINHYPKR